MKNLKTLSLMATLLFATTGCATKSPDPDLPSFKHYQISIDNQVRTVVSVPELDKMDNVFKLSNKSGDATVNISNATAYFDIALNKDTRLFPIAEIDEKTGVDVDAYYFVKFVETDTGLSAKISNLEGCHEVLIAKKESLEACGISISKL